MGFFSDVLNAGAKKLVSNVVGEVIDKAVDVLPSELRDVIRSSNDTFARTEYDQTGSGKPVVKEPEMSESAKIVCSKLERIIACEFPSYGIGKEILPSTIRGPIDARPYTYGIFQEGALKAVIMVTDHNKEKQIAFRHAERAAEQAGMPFINFYTHFPNTEQYITERLHNYIV